jgi:hypothetical protein
VILVFVGGGPCDGRRFFDTPHDPPFLLGSYFTRPDGVELVSMYGRDGTRFEYLGDLPAEEWPLPPFYD